MGKRRVLLKLSGESLCKPGDYGIDASCVRTLANEIQAGLSAHNDVEVALILGGGNLLRGATLAGDEIDRVTADTMGMLATVMNALALRAGLRRIGIPATVMSALPAPEGAEPFSSTVCIEHLRRGQVTILAGGTGNPYFTTDTTASLRALQIGAQVVLKGTKVKGIYSSDPNSDPEAVFYERLTHVEALKQGLRIMDATAISMCMEHNLKIRVFNMWEAGNIGRAIGGEAIGSLVE